MKVTKDRSLTYLESLLLHLKIAHLKSEQEISPAYIEWCMAVHFVILVDALFPKLHFFGSLKLDLESMALPMFCVLAVLTVAFGVCLGLSLVLGSQTKIHEKLPRFITISVSLKPVFENILYPLLVWSFTHTIFGSEHWIVFACLGGLVVPIGLATLAFCHLFLANTLPTVSVCGVVRLQNSLVHSAVKTLVAILGVVVKYLHNQSERKSVLVATAFLSALMAVHIIVRPTHYCSRLSRANLAFSLSVTLIAGWSAVIVDSVSSSLNLGIASLLLSFVIKLSDLITQYHDRVDIFDKKTMTHLRLRGLFVVTQVFRRKEENLLTLEELVKLNEVKYNVKERGIKNGLAEEEIDSAVSSYRNFSSFLAKVGEDKHKSIDMAKFELIARIMSPTENTFRLFVALNRYKKLTGQSMLGRIEFRLMEKLLEGRLKAMFYLLTDESKPQSSYLEQLFNNYIINAEQNINTKVADICLPLKHKWRFLKMNEKLGIIVSKRIDIHSSILSKLGSASSLLSWDLYQGNIKAKKAAQDLEKYLTTEVESVEMPPSYYYPPQFVLQALILHDTVKAKSLLKDFKNSLIQWDIFKKNEQSEKVEHLDEDSAVIMFNLKQTNRGHILDISPNWQKMFGHLKEGQNILSYNVNDLFLESLAIKHVEMMKQNYGLTLILGYKRDFYMKTFANEMKAVIFTLRLWPSLEKDLTGVVAIGPSPEHYQGLSMALLTPEFDIYRAEEDFWDTVGRMRHGLPLSSALQLSPTIQTINKLIVFFDAFLPEAAALGLMQDSSSPLAAVCTLGRALVALNGRCGLEYNMIKGDYSDGEIMTCRIGASKFLDLHFVTLWVRNDPRRVSGKYSTRHDSFAAIEASRMASEVSAKLANELDELMEQDLGEKLRAWTEDDKLADADVVVTELARALGKVVDRELRLNSPDLRKRVVELGKILGVYQMDTVRTLNIEKGSYHQSVINSMTTKNSQTVEFLRPSTISPRLNNPQRKVPPSDMLMQEVEKSKASKNQSKISNQPVSMNHSQTKKKYQTTMNGTDPASNQIGLENRDILVGYEFADPESSEKIDKNQFARIEIDLKGYEAANSRNFTKTKGESKMGYTKSSAIKAELPERSRSNRYAEAIDHNPIDVRSSVANTEMSVAMSERRMLVWLQHRRETYWKYLFTATMLISISVALGSWIIYEKLITDNYYFTTFAFRANKIFSDIFLNMSQAISVYVTRMSFNYCLQNGCLTAESLKSLETLYETNDINTYLMNLQHNYSLETKVALANLMTEVVRTDTLASVTLQEWIRNIETNFYEKTHRNSHFEVDRHPTEVSLSYVQAITSLVSKLEWVLGYELENIKNNGSFPQSEYYNEVEHSIINDGLQLTMERFYKITDSLYGFYQSSPYIRNLITLLACEITGLLLGYILEVICIKALQRYLTSAIESYSLLTYADLCYELDKLHYCRAFFLGNDAYDGQERMNQAVLGFIKTSGRDEEKFYARFKIEQRLGFLFPELQDVFTKKIIKLGRTPTVRMKTNRLYSGVIKSALIATVLLINMLTCSMAILIIHSVVNKMTSIKQVASTSTSHILKLQLDMATASIYNPYAISGLNSGWADTASLLKNYNNDQQKFTTFFNQERQTLIKMLGNDNIFEKIIYGNLCKELLNLQKVSSSWTVCRNLSQQIATQGLLKYSIYARMLTDDKVSELDKMLNISSSAAPKMINESQINALANLFYEQQFLEIREGHPLIISKTVSAIISELERAYSPVEQIILVLRWVIRYSAIAGICLPFFLLILYIDGLIKDDNTNALYTFKILSPDIIMGNQYLFSKFRQFFKTSSY